MKRIIAVVLCFSMILTGCSSFGKTNINNDILMPQTSTENLINEDVSPNSTESKSLPEETATKTQAVEESDNIHFGSLSDPDLLTYVENSVYENLIEDFDSDDIFIERVDAVYLSEEYVEELSYNSQSNEFFGFTLAELENEFQGTRYVFTLGENGQTTVVPLEEVYDDTYGQIIKNVVVGSGVILVCVVVSAATAVSAPAVSVIFAASAATGTEFALGSGALSFATAAIVRGYQTHDMAQAMKTGTVAASESFKWGAVTGAVLGGAKTAVALKGATLNGLTMNEAATIQKDSKWPLVIIKKLHSQAEYEIYKEASLVPTQLPNGTWVLSRPIDWNLVDASGSTNVERVMAGAAPLDPTGEPFELHHVGMKADGPLAILTKEEHHLKDNYKTLHWEEEGKNITNTEWNAQKKQIWNAILKMVQGAVK